MFNPFLKYVIKKTNLHSPLFGDNSIDLYLVCLFELKYGSLGSVQAFDNSFGSYSKQPYIYLDGDDRRGINFREENLFINGDKNKEICNMLKFN